MDPQESLTLVSEATNAGKKRTDVPDTSADDVLSDGGLIWYALLDRNPKVGAGVIPSSAEQSAREAYRRCFIMNPDAVRSCRGKTWEDAKNVLNGIFRRDN